MDTITIRYGTPKDGEKEMQVRGLIEMVEAIREVEAMGNTFLSAFAGPDALGDNGCQLVHTASDGTTFFVSHSIDCACVIDPDGNQVWEDPSDICLAAIE